MPYKYKNGCKCCLLIRTSGGVNSAVYKRIEAYLYDEVNQIDIRREFPAISRDSLRNHIRKHQWIKLDDVPSQAKVIKRNMTTHDSFRQALLEKAEELLRDGDLKGLTATAALQAAKQSMDKEEKQKDRQFELYKMINQFASGEMNGQLPKSDPQRITDGSSDSPNPGV